MSAVARLSRVEKRYQDFVLGPVDMELQPGRVRALIGPNGAGKSTAMDILAGLRRPDAGAVEVLGQPIGARHVGWKAQVGHASEQQPFYENWTAGRNLRFLAGFFPRWSRQLQAELAARFDLPLGRKVVALSKGNRVKLALVAALARRPRLLLLDEPTAGLDPLVRGEVLDTLAEFLAEEELTMLYSTHILSDLGRLADDLTFVRAGQVVLECQRDELEYAWRRLTFRHAAGALPEATGRLLLGHRSQGSMHAAVTYDSARALDQLRALGATQIEAQRLTLDEIAVQVLRAKEPFGGGAHA